MSKKIRGALARGYCTKRNENKVLDVDLIEDMVLEIEKLSRPEPKQTSSGLTAFEYTRLISWMKDLNREPAITAFTSGACRDAGRAFEKYLGGGRDERADS